MVSLHYQYPPGKDWNGADSDEYVKRPELIGTTTQYAWLPSLNFQNTYTYDAGLESDIADSPRQQRDDLWLRRPESAERAGELVGWIIRLWLRCAEPENQSDPAGCPILSRAFRESLGVPQLRSA